MATFDIKIQNVDYNTSEDSIRDFLSKFGRIGKITMLKS